MNALWLIVLLALPLAFAISRIAIRLQQQPGLAALTSALICWQLIALAIGRAPLAGAMALLIAAASLLASIQWLQQTRPPKQLVRLSLLGLSGVLWGYATLFPALPIQLALLFFAALISVALGTGVACYKARLPIAKGSAGYGPLAMLVGWLVIRTAANIDLIRFG